MRRPFPVLVALGLASPAMASTDCESLFAAWIADDVGLYDCDASFVATPSYCPAGALTPNDCAAQAYADPASLSLSAGGGAMVHQWLNPCRDGTTTCTEEEQIVCYDGTRPMAYWDKAVDMSGQEMTSNGWVFFFGAEGKTCAGDDCWDRYTTGASVDQNAMSTYHPEYAPEPQNVPANGLMSAQPQLPSQTAPGTTIPNNFAHFNRIRLNRCSDGASDASQVVDTDADPLVTRTATVYHHGARISEGLLNHIDQNGLGNLPNLTNATHILLAGSSDGATWLVMNADRLAAQLAVLAPNAEVRIVIDGNFKPMLEGETRYNANPGNHIFDHVWDNPNGRLLPSDGVGATSEDYGTGPYDTMAAGSWADRNVLLDAGCESRHGARAAICHDMQHVLLNHVETPFFVVADQRDPVTRDSSLYAIDPDYALPVPEYRRRVLDQGLAVLGLYPSGDSTDLIGLGWSTALFLPLENDEKHTHFEHDARMATEMWWCNGGAQVDAWTLTQALHSWLIYDTAFDAVEEPNTGAGDHWVTGGSTVCGSPR